MHANQKPVESSYNTCLSVGYPEVKAELKPRKADDGIFWVTKDEFFDFFQSIYLSASNMTQFLED